MNELTRPEPAPRDAVSERYEETTFVYFDIETIPCQDAEILDDFRSSVKAPASYKKPDSIKKWLDENREAEAQNAMSRTSFDGGLGHVCTVAWAVNDGPIRVAHAASLDDERDVLAAFFSAVDPYHSQTFVGHNVAAFDLPFVTKRAILLGVTIPHAIPRDPKPWGKGVADTMAMWAGSRDRISMDRLCKLMGVRGKDGFDGSMVADAWARGEHDTIAEYCRDDVYRTREIHKRFLRVGW